MAGWRNAAIMAGHWVLHGFGMFVVEEKASGTFVGRVGPFYPPVWPGFEVGWGMATEFRGKGYAVEAARAAIDWSFATFEMDRIIHCIDRENAASQAVARRLGQQDGEVDLGKAETLGYSAMGCLKLNRVTICIRLTMRACANDVDVAFRPRHRVARRDGRAAAGAGGIAVSRFRNGDRRTAGRGFRAGVGGACRELFDRRTAPVSAAHAPLIALSTGNVVVFWLFTRALFDETFRLRWWHALVWAAVAAFSFVNCMWIAPASGARLSIIAINLIALGFIVLAVTQTVASWSSDLVERRRSVRVFIVSAAALYGGLNAVLQIAMSGSGSAEIANTVNGRSGRCGGRDLLCDDARRRRRSVPGCA